MVISFLRWYMCMENYQHIYIYTWICILHMSAVRLPVRGHKRWQWLQDLHETSGPTVPPLRCEILTGEASWIWTKKEGTRGREKASGWRKAPVCGQFPVGGWCNSQPDLARRLADFLRFPDLMFFRKIWWVIFADSSLGRFVGKNPSVCRDTILQQDWAFEIHTVRSFSHFDPWVS